MGQLFDPELFSQQIEQQIERVCSDTPGNAESLTVEIRQRQVELFCNRFLLNK